jgi:hypothetical protein
LKSYSAGKPPGRFLAKTDRRFGATSGEPAPSWVPQRQKIGPQQSSSPDGVPKTDLKF